VAEVGAVSGPFPDPVKHHLENRQRIRLPACFSRERINQSRVERASGHGGGLADDRSIVIWTQRAWNNLVVIKSGKAGCEDVAEETILKRKDGDVAAWSARGIQDVCQEGFAVGVRRSLCDQFLQLIDQHGTGSGM
jgi:hypothetical protein